VRLHYTLRNNCRCKIIMHIHTVKVKVKFPRYRPGVAQRVGRGIALLFHNRGTRRGKWSAARPGRTLLSGKNRYPFYRGWVGPRAGLDVRKIPSPPGFDPGSSSTHTVRYLIDIKLKATFANILKATYHTINDLVNSCNI